MSDINGKSMFDKYETLLEDFETSPFGGATVQMSTKVGTITLDDGRLAEVKIEIDAEIEDQ